MYFEIYQDQNGEYRWRARSGADITADSGEEYESREGARQTVDRVKTYAPEADILEVGKAAFEVYEDKGEEWRWRLVASNGRIIADSGEGYTERNDAVEAVGRIRQHSSAPIVPEETET